MCCEELEVERLNENDEWIKVKKRVLPQGAPTSPILTNIVAQRLDLQLSRLAKRCNLKYTRYADDITFSSMHYVYKKNGAFILELENIIKEQGFNINAAKTRLQQNDHDRQIVTGLVVNEKVNITRKYIKDLRRWLYLLERYGYEYANKIFLINYKTKKLNSKGKVTIFDVLGGKLEYLKMVIGYNDDRYKKLNSRFEKQYDIFHPQQILDGKENAAIKEKIKRTITHSKKEKINETPEKETKKDKIDLSKHKPKDVRHFLSSFREPPLKWLTHSGEVVNEIFDIVRIKEEALTAFKDLSKKLVIPQTLYARVYAFITGKTSEGNKVKWIVNSRAYDFNWSSDEVIKATKKTSVSPVKSENYKDDIIAFSSSIRVNQNFQDIVRKAATSSLGSDYTNYEFEYINLDEADFYTDVEKLRIGLGFIFNSINKYRLDNNKIKIEFKNNRGVRRFRIIHINSISKKTLDKNVLLSGDLKEAETNFYQICDWSIIAKNPNDEEVNRINILYDASTNKPPKEKISEPIEGFTHELIFY